MSLLFLSPVKNAFSISFGTNVSTNFAHQGSISPRNLSTSSSVGSWLSCRHSHLMSHGRKPPDSYVMCSSKPSVQFNSLFSSSPFAMYALESKLSGTGIVCTESQLVGESAVVRVLVLVVDHWD